MRPAAYVLYEDSAVKPYGLHELVRTCVRERLKRDVRLEDRELRGNGNVLKSCLDPGRIGRNNEPVVAVLDGDDAYTIAELPKGSSAAQIEAAIRKRSKNPDQLHVCVLDRNLESVLQAIANCDDSVDRNQLKRALRKTDLNARDLILLAAARGARHVRDCVLDRMPTLRDLIDRLAALVEPS